MADFMLKTVVIGNNAHNLPVALMKHFFAIPLFGRCHDLLSLLGSAPQNLAVYFVPPFFRPAITCTHIRVQATSSAAHTAVSTFELFGHYRSPCSTGT